MNVCNSAFTSSLTKWLTLLPWFLKQLYRLVKKKTVSHEGDWIQEVLFFLLEHAYFQPIKGDTKVSNIQCIITRLALKTGILHV